MRTDRLVQNWFSTLDPKLYALIVGALIGAVGGTLGLLIAVAGPLIAAAAVLGILAGLFVLTSVQVALYGVVAVMMFLPFGTLPFSIGFTPTLIDLAVGGFVLIYIMQWMTGRRSDVKLTPVHLLITLYILWILMAFALGVQYADPTSLILRQFAETLLAFGLAFVVVDLVRTPEILRRLVLVVIVCAGVQAALAITLWLLPEDLVERVLRALSRIGYPAGNIIRYIESNPALPERAIGTWVDPNTLGGTLAVAGAMIAPQVFARRPVLRYRWVTLIVLGLVGLALLLTFSRTAMAALAVALVIIALVRYRSLIPLMLVAGAILLLLPQTQGYIERFIDAFTAGDLATQMRIGETSDSLRLISRYPIFGVGFTGTPEIDLYTSVANMYLIMANQIGLVGVALFGTTMGGVLIYGARSWRHARENADLDAIHLGYHAALVAALVCGVGDLYFFRIDFQGSIVLFWLTIALALSASRVALESTVDKSPRLG
jgi:hypothetical protein